MEETKNTIAIILQNNFFRERDSLVTVYTKEFGRLNLIARGTKTPKSKMRGHLEPLTLVRIMIVKGKKWDYLGSVVTEKAFLRIREDYEKILLATKVLKIYIEHVREGEMQEDLFDLLFLFLEFLDKNDIETHSLVYSFYLLKFLCFVGLRPELDTYLDSKKRIVEKKHCFDLAAGGLTEEKKSQHCLNVSVDAIKVLRLVVKNDFEKLVKLKINNRLSAEISSTVKAFFDYNMRY